MENDELLYWLALRFVNGVGNLGFKSLLEFFNSPYDIFQASHQELTSVSGIGPKTASHIKAFNDWQRIENELKQIRQLNIDLITCNDKRYPVILKNIFDYPPFLYVKGTLESDALNIALVGSRNASTYGIFTTERLARELALNGVTVVSGMARGIDSAAHRGALAGRGRTIAVLGCGLDIIYPAENKNLYEKIAYGGAVISEFSLGTPPNASNFPMRNRIISGLSLGVVVVEANERSGSLITARIALEQGREVFAVPGNIDSSISRGSHKLIKEGAKLIENVDDILEEIMPQMEREQSGGLPEVQKINADIINKNVPAEAPTRPVIHQQISNLSKNEEIVFNVLTAKPVNIDSIIEKSGLNVNETLNCLLNLELHDAILQLPGKLYKLKEP
jgi:DNA processing protein